MENLVKRITVRLPENDIATIEEYPGENISEKTRALLTAHSILIGKELGCDLTEKYEILLKSYLEKFNPELEKELAIRRDELKKYRDTLKALDILKEKADELQERIDTCFPQDTECDCKEFQEEIDRFYKWSKNFIEKTVAECVIVRKNPKRSSK